MWQFFSATTSKAATGWKHHSLKSSCPSLATMTLNNPTSLSESAVKQNERWKALGQNNVVHHRLFLASALRDFHPHHIQSHFQTILHWFKISEGIFYFGRQRQVKRLLARSRGSAQRLTSIYFEAGENCFDLLPDRHWQGGSASELRAPIGGWTWSTWLPELTNKDNYRGTSHTQHALQVKLERYKYTIYM